MKEIIDQDRIEKIIEENGSPGFDVGSTAKKFLIFVPKLQEELTIENRTDLSVEKVLTNGEGAIIINLGNDEEYITRIVPKIEKAITQVFKQVNNEQKITADHFTAIISEVRKIEGFVDDIYPTDRDYVQNHLNQVCNNNELYGTYERHAKYPIKAYPIEAKNPFVFIFDGPAGKEYQNFGDNTANKVGTACAVLLVQVGEDGHRKNHHMIQPDVFIKTYRNKNGSPISQTQLEEEEYAISLPDKEKSKLIAVEKSDKQSELRRSSTQSKQSGCHRR